MSDSFRRTRLSRARVPVVLRGCQVLVTTRPPATLLAEVRGDLDVATVPHLSARLATAPGPHRLVVLDLTAVQFLGAAGITALLRIRERVRGHHGTFRVVAPAGPVLRLLSMVDLATTLDVRSTQTDALGPDEGPQR